jgi:hypothetical protein
MTGAKGERTPIEQRKMKKKKKRSQMLVAPERQLPRAQKETKSKLQGGKR